MISKVTVISFSVFLYLFQITVAIPGQRLPSNIREVHDGTKPGLVGPAATQITEDFQDHSNRFRSRVALLKKQIYLSWQALRGCKPKKSRSQSGSGSGKRKRKRKKSKSGYKKGNNWRFQQVATGKRTR